MTATRTTTIRAGEPLPDDVLSKEVTRLSGESVALRSFFPREEEGQQPSLLVFVRQFACAGCSERMTELLIHLEILRTAGVNVIVIGCGTVEQAKTLGDRLALGTRPITVVTDPSLAIHRAVGLTRTLWGVVGAKGTWNLLRALSHGHKNGWNGGDFYQLGGTILLDRDGKVVMHHEERHLGETMPIGDVAERALALLASSSVHREDIP